VELQLLTEDGSAGYQGTLTAPGAAPLTALLQWAERVCLACDAAQRESLAQRVNKARLHPPKDFAQVLVRVPMPCGVGACDACRVETGRGERHACTDGPVFDLLTLE
jgi:dihydroorotate dehydrogenase electron transfer subunit